MKFIAVMTFVSAALLASASFAQQLRLSKAEIEALAKIDAGAGTSGVSGVRSTVIYGDPTKPGPYTIEIRVPAHTAIQAHTHSDPRTAVVISGEWFFGYGRFADPALTKKLVAGSFYTEPANDPHFALTRDQPAIVYIFGHGPTDTSYIDQSLAPKP